MAVPSTGQALLDLVRKSAVISQERLEAYVSALPAIPEDPRQFAAMLLRDGILTNYQARQLLRGRYKGFTFGKFRVLEQLGEGGTAGVYLCAHLLMRRRVAVKVLPASRTKDAAFLERFYREARVVAALDHPNIVRAHDVDSDGNIHFIVMEFVDGLSLQEIVAKHGPLSVDRACHYARQAAAGLQYLHEKGLVHRDVKPGNLLLDRSGTVKIIDMGLGRFAADEKDQLTHQYDAHSILGTADYLSPEQGRNSHNVDIRADIYSLGATLYFVLTGQAPFEGGSVTQKLLHHQMSEPRPAREVRAAIPEELSALVARMMAKDPKARLQTPQEVFDALAPWTQTPIAPPSEEELPSISLAAKSEHALEPLRPLTAGKSGVLTVNAGGSMRRVASAAAPAAAPVGAATAVAEGPSGLPMAIYDDPLPPPPPSPPPGKRPNRVPPPAPKSLPPADPPSASTTAALLDTTSGLQQNQATLRTARVEPAAAQPPVWEALFTQRRARWPYVAAACIVACGLLSGVWYLITTWPSEIKVTLVEGHKSNNVDPRIQAAQPSAAGGAALNLAPGEAKTHDKHGQPVQRLALTPDRKLLISCGDDRQAKVWEPATGRELLTLGGHGGPVLAAAVSGDDRLIVTAGADKTLIVWDRSNGQERRRLAGHESKVLGVAITSDNTVAVSCGEDRTIRLWNVQLGTALVTYRGHEGPVNSVAVDASRRILSASSDQTVRLWEFGRPQEIRRFVGHTAGVLMAVFSPDGKRIASCGLDDAIRLWDVDSGKQLAALVGHSPGIRSVAFAPDGRRLVSAGQDGSVRVWDVESGRELLRLRGHARTVTSAAFLDDGKHVASSSQDGTVRLWRLPDAQPRAIDLAGSGPPLGPVDADAGLIAGVEAGRGGLDCAALLATGRHALIALPRDGANPPRILLLDLATRREIASFTAHDDRITSLAASPDNRFFVSGSRDKSIRLWSLATGLPLDRWDGHGDTVRGLAFTADGRHVLSCSDDGTARLWEVASGKERKQFEGHVGGVNALAIAPDGKTALTAGEDKTVIQWDLETGRELRRFQGHGSGVASVAFAAQGPYAASAGKDNGVRVWNLDSGQTIHAWQAHADGLRVLAFSPDGQLLLTGGAGGSNRRGGAARDNALKLWDARGGRLLWRFDGHDDAVASVAFIPREPVAVSAGADGGVKLWRLPRPRPGDGQSVKLEGHALNVECVAFAPDNRHALSGGHDRVLRLWDVDNGKCVRVLEGHRGMIHGVAIARDGKRALSAGADQTVRLWDLASGRELLVLAGHGKPVMAVAFAPDGNLAASVSQDQTLRLWDLRDGKEVRSMEAHQGAAWCVAFTADGQRVFTAGHDKAIRVWDVATGEMLRQFSAPAPIYALAVGPDGQRVLTGGRDNAVRLWDVAEGKELGTWRGHGDLVTALAFSPDETRALSASTDRTVRLWDLAGGRLLRTLSGHDDQVWGVCFSPDGRAALSASADRTLRLWGLPE